MLHLATKQMIYASDALIYQEWTGADIQTATRHSIINVPFSLSLDVYFTSEQAGYGKVIIYDASGSVIDYGERESMFMVKNGRNIVSPSTYPALNTFPAGANKIRVEIRTLTASSASITPSVQKIDAASSMQLIGTDTSSFEDFETVTARSGGFGAYTAYASGTTSVIPVSLPSGNETYRYRIVGYSVSIPAQGAAEEDITIELQIFRWNSLSIEPFIIQHASSVLYAVRETIPLDMVVQAGGSVTIRVENNTLFDRKLMWAITANRLLS